MPWTNPDARRAGCLHLGGTLREVAAAEAEVAAGRHPDRPFVLAAQPSLFDASRAPAGQHTLWTYCHVPARSTLDMTEAIEGQIERFAPGFRDVVLARHTADSSWYEAYNPNIIGGDIAGGSHGGLQLVLRPARRAVAVRHAEPAALHVLGLDAARAAACTACAATTRPRRRWPARCAEPRRPPS